MTDFFKNLNDNDFFSDKLTHIYFNGYVNDKSVDELIENIREASKIKEEKGVVINPKPILIHINSNGGLVYDGLRFLSVFKISSVPIATIIDNYSFSSATILSTYSPYRVMTKNSFCLLHNYNYKIATPVKRNEMISRIKEVELLFGNIINMYLQKTKIKKEELEELLQHDLFLDYKYCLEKGVVDRVIDFDNKTDMTSIPSIINLLKDTSAINLYLPPCPKDIHKLDLEIRKNNDKSVKYLIYPIHNNCEEDNEKQKKPEKPNKSSDIEAQNNYYDFFHTFNLINRIKSINSLKIAIIDVPLSIDEILPLLYTNKIYMYSHTFIICNFLYFKSFMTSILLDDMFKNYKTILNRIKTILKQKTKMSLKEIGDINRKYLIINPEEAIKIGLCHEIIQS